ncbi:hypothetical protein GF327_10290 [Candidatus Woesearchaeota archaeon]|nr:hypothetical protein [Candidatus Woesearchaeota archaeon]
MKKGLILSLTSLGVSSIVTQIILMREFLNIFSGNELVIGITFSNWLFLTGTGAYLGKIIKKKKIRFFMMSQLLLSILPFFMIFIIRYSRNNIFDPGVLLGLNEIVVFSFLVLAPYCLISGSLLTLACSIFIRFNLSIGKVYFIDNIGDILGGLVFSFFLVYFFNSFQAAFFIFLLNLIPLIYLGLKNNKFILISSIVILLIVSLLFLTVDIQKRSLELFYNNQVILYEKSSPYGHIAVTKSQNQLNFYENGIILFSTENTIENEETIHYALSQTDNPENILLISGGVSGTINEILKYGVNEIDYVELDPNIISIGKRFTTNLNFQKVNIVNKDARLYIQSREKKYDAVIVDLPDPKTAQINRFYTLEFFSDVKKILTDKGVVSLSLSSSENYLNKELIKLHSSVYNTFGLVFKNIIFIPGDEVFFIASGKRLNYNISESLNKKNIHTEYVNEFYLKGKFTKERLDNFLDSIDKDVQINRELKPITYYFGFLTYTGLTEQNYTLVLIFFIIITIYFLSRLNSITFSIFTTGFSAASLQIVLIIVFQILYGYVYGMISLIITFFMLGLAIGSFTVEKYRIDSKRNLILTEFSMICFAIILGFFLVYLKRSQLGYETIIFPFLTLIPAVIAGIEFPISSGLLKNKPSKKASSLYNADLIGACLGSFIASIIFIPLFGIFWTCAFVGIIKILSIIILAAK